MSQRRSTLVLPIALAALGAVPALAVGGSGLSVSPAIIQHAAVPGTVGAVRVANATGQPMKISVSAHPWLQSATGAAVPNQRVALPGVRTSISSFTLASGAAQVVSIGLSGPPAHGSLYGNIDVVGLPAQPSHAPNAVTIGYRLVASLRLDPLHPAFAAQAGRAVVTGNHRRGVLALAVRNSGNTVQPIGGSVYVKGARGALSGTIAPFRILPGATVNLPVLALDGSLPAGAYTMSATLKEGGRPLLKATRRFGLR